MKKVLIIMFLVSIVAFANKGKEIYKKYNCNTCHGKYGNKPLQPDYPKIIGQQAKYIRNQIKAIRDEKRTNNLSPIMRASITKITDAEIKTVSLYLSKLKIKKKIKKKIIE